MAAPDGVRKEWRRQVALLIPAGLPQPFPALRSGHFSAGEAGGAGGGQAGGCRENATPSGTSSGNLLLCPCLHLNPGTAARKTGLTVYRNPAWGPRAPLPVSSPTCARAGKAHCTCSEAPATGRPSCPTSCKLLGQEHGLGGRRGGNATPPSLSALSHSAVLEPVIGRGSPLPLPTAETPREQGTPSRREPRAPMPAGGGDHALGLRTSEHTKQHGGGGERDSETLYLRRRRPKPAAAPASAPDTFPWPAGVRSGHPRSPRLRSLRGGLPSGAARQAGRQSPGRCVAAATNPGSGQLTGPKQKLSGNFRRGGPREVGWREEAPPSPAAGLARGGGRRAPRFPKRNSRANSQGGSCGTLRTIRLSVACASLAPSRAEAFFHAQVLEPP